MPVWNGERYLSEAVESALAQEGLSFEIVIVDDGSTDGSPAIAARQPAPVRTVRQDHSGLGTALNRGLEEARGDLVAFLDSDDRYVPGKLARQESLLDRDRDLDAVFGHLRCFISPELTEEDRRRIRCPVEPQPGWSTGTLLARREVFARHGPFGTDWKAGVFVDWLSRARRDGLRSTMLPEVLLERRVHPANNWLRRREARGDLLRILKANLDRRRSDGDR
jgi:glycosyltransferase involved in cell wall biosynthesis